MLHFEYFFSSVCVINNISTDACRSSGLCVLRVVGRHNRTPTVGMLTARYFPAPVIGQMFVDNRDFYTPSELDAAVNFNSFEYRLDRGMHSATEMLPLKRRGRCATASRVCRICVLLTHLL